MSLMTIAIHTELAIIIQSFTRTNYGRGESVYFFSSQSHRKFSGMKVICARDTEMYAAAMLLGNVRCTAHCRVFTDIVTDVA